MTGGGATAGIDFALALLAELAGTETAEAIQLNLEHAPAPPFDAGSPETAPEKVVKSVRTRLKPLVEERARLVREAAKRLDGETRSLARGAN
jgi:cyclohexyl-isocyanide hydratase